MLAGKAGVEFDTYLTEHWLMTTELGSTLTTNDITSPATGDGVTDLHY